jgi:hypothetical protein
MNRRRCLHRSHRLTAPLNLTRQAHPGADLRDARQLPITRREAARSWRGPQTIILMTQKRRQMRGVPVFANGSTQPSHAKPSHLTVNDGKTSTYSPISPPPYSPPRIPPNSYITSSTTFCARPVELQFTSCRGNTSAFSRSLLMTTKPPSLTYFYDPLDIPASVWDVAESHGYDYCMRDRQWKPIATAFVKGHHACDSCTSVSEQRVPGKMGLPLTAIDLEIWVQGTQPPSRRTASSAAYTELTAFHPRSDSESSDSQRPADSAYGRRTSPNNVALGPSTTRYPIHPGSRRFA